MNRGLYAVHRWISLLALVQLAVWSASGLLFALLPERRVLSPPVPGAHDAPLVAAEGFLTPTDVLAALPAAQRQRVHRLELRRAVDTLVYVVRAGHDVVRIDARTGAPAPVTEGEARAVARRDQPGGSAVRRVERIDGDAPVEYRGRPLPAWRVTLADAESTAVYVDARIGEVTGRRSDTWRVNDFLWSLHIMDYRRHENFRTPLLAAFAAVANLTALSGLVLWITRLARRRRKTPATPPPAREVTG